MALKTFWMQCPPEGRVIAAISGGLDSMVLLEGLSRLSADSKDRKRLLVVHVNHALRGSESNGDENLVLERAALLGLEAKTVKLNWQGQTATQESCRKKRESVWRDLCRKSDDRIWLAHHLNDQAETIFFRLMRGTGARGLRGILPINGPKVRPFLGLEKQELRAAALAWGVSWREDGSNADSEAYERNWIRSFFPVLEARRPGFQRKLAALAAEAQGWRFAQAQSLDVYEEGGISFLRWKAGSDTAALVEQYRLSRAHAENLVFLLGKSTGRLEAKGVRFTWSGGILLSERGERFSSSLQGTGAFRMKSALGSWELCEPFDSMAPRSGERLKKEFQELRVPLFFRNLIPVIGLRGRPIALLPKRIEGKLSGSVRFFPSKLATWWLGS